MYTSMEVQADSYVEELDGTRKLVNTAFFVMVALDEAEHPVQVPGLIVETEEEKAAWDAGRRRSELRKQRRILFIRLHLLVVYKTSRNTSGDQ